MMSKTKNNTIRRSSNSSNKNTSKSNSRMIVSSFVCLMIMMILYVFVSTPEKKSTSTRAATSSSSAAATTTTNMQLPRALRNTSLEALLEGDCDLLCQHNTSCARGIADYSWHPVQPSTNANDDIGRPFDFHLELSRNGRYCICPFGLTGLFCDIIYESCTTGNYNNTSDATPVHNCYNGGECIPGLLDIYGDDDKLYCHCKDGYDENGTLTARYSGKYCEVAVTAAELSPATPSSLYSAKFIPKPVQRCGGGDNKLDEYCAHGGTCKTTWDNSTTALDVNPCHCPDGYTGRHCEYVIGTVPDCSLSCFHGGACRLGRINPNTANVEENNNDDTLANNNNSASSLYRVAVVNRSNPPWNNFMYCECPAIYEGDYCEINTETCGASIDCLHGSTCIEIDQYDGNGIVINTDFHCDCSTTKGKTFAGRHCQHERTISCPEQDTFCTQNGTCPRFRNGYCSCPENKFGPHCEYDDDDDVQNVFPLEHNSGDEDYGICMLRCHNGGVCRKGIKMDNDDVHPYDPELSHMMLNQSYDKNFEHCICEEGYVGLQCEYEYIPCRGGEDGSTTHVCFHGSSCSETTEAKFHPNGTLDHVTTPPSCDCESAASRVAGRYCQYVAHDSCPPSTATNTSTATARSSGSDPEETLFCVNGGTCDTDENGNAICKCTFGYYGSHCELLDPEDEDIYIVCPSTTAIARSSANPEEDVSCASGGGACDTDEHGKAICNCTFGYHGSHCELLANEGGESHANEDEEFQANEDETLLANEDEDINTREPISSTTCRCTFPFLLIFLSLPLLLGSE